MDGSLESLIQNPDVFEESYVPAKLPHRARHIKKLFFCYSPALERKRPIHVWIHGKPGSGKTTTVKYFLTLVRKKHSIEGSYINCWECRSLYSILDKLILKLRILRAEKPDGRFKMERLKRHLGEKLFIVILDEIDQPSPKERNAILYNLCGLNNLGLICISYSRQSYYELDNRVRSRLSPHMIEFEPYSEDELISILNERAVDALSPSSWNLKDLSSIASLSKGDIRVAIQTLKNAAYWAQEECSNTLVYSHIKDGVRKAQNIKKKYLLNRLTRDHRILYGLIKEQGEILSGYLWELYLQRCSEKDLKPIAPRTYTLYVNRLRDLGLVEAERAKVRGKVRVFRAAN
jgi:cell division control protein 6